MEAEVIKLNWWQVYAVLTLFALFAAWGFTRAQKRAFVNAYTVFSTSWTIYVPEKLRKYKNAPHVANITFAKLPHIDMTSASVFGFVAAYLGFFLKPGTPLETDFDTETSKHIYELMLNALIELAEKGVLREDSPHFSEFLEIIEDIRHENFEQKNKEFGIFLMKLIKQYANKNLVSELEMLALGDLEGSVERFLSYAPINALLTISQSDMEIVGVCLDPKIGEYEIFSRTNVPLPFSFKFRVLTVLPTAEVS